MNFFKKRKNKAEIEYHRPDNKLIVALLALAVFGFAILLSASSIISYARHGDPYFFVKKQLPFLILGFFVFWLLSKIDYHYWQKYAFGFLIFSVVLLFLVFIPFLQPDNVTANRWIKITDSHTLQPSEFVKLFFLLYLAAWINSRKENISAASGGIGAFIFLLGLIAILLVRQPDMGSLFIIGSTSMIVYFVGGGKIRHMVLLTVFGAAVFFLFLNVNVNSSAIKRMQNYQSQRIECFLNPESAKCYQTRQALIAVGSGGLWGRGFGESRQKYFYLPEVWSDSVFAIAAEELGFIASSLLILLYFYIFYRGYLIAKNAPDDFGRILAIGIVSWVMVQAVVNIGGMINLIPMTGLPLPLVSQGGSAVLAILAAFGILINISKQAQGAERGMRKKETQFPIGN